MLKVFRKITRGENPDITTHRVLTEAGSDHVAALYGWIEATTDDGATIHLAMLQQFLRTASDGWEIALASVRDLFSEGDLHADEVGGDFASEAARLGTALADVHAQLRDAFGIDLVDAGHTAEQMGDRLDRAIEVVPELGAHRDRLRGAYAALADLGKVPGAADPRRPPPRPDAPHDQGLEAGRLRGRAGEATAERLLPDSPWRDVAGMPRSFDYAPHAMARSMPEDDPAVLSQRDHRAEEWAAPTRLPSWRRTPDPT